MERWQYVYLLVGVGMLAVSLGFAVATDANLLLVGLGCAVGAGALVVLVRPRAYAPFVAVIGALAAVIGGSVVLEENTTLGTALVVVGLLAVGRSVQFYRARAVR